MCDNGSYHTPKKLRQISITESFGSVVRKRKPPSIDTSPTGLLFSNTVWDEMSSSNQDGSAASSKRLRDTHGKTSQRSSPSRSVYALKVAATSSTSGVQNSTLITKTYDDAAVGGGSESFSEGSQELFDIKMTEKKEAIDRLLKHEDTDDSILSRNTPTLKEDWISKSDLMDPQQEPLLLYDSLDTADTSPTPDFDMDFEEEDSAPIKWMGIPKSHLRTVPNCLVPFPQLQASKNHTVLFDTSYYDFGPPPPSKSNFVDAWDSDHVKLPCSPKSLFPTPGEERSLTSRWELIENALLSDINTSRQLEKAIKQYNVRFHQPFAALHTLLNESYGPTEREHFFSNTLPEIITLALSLRAVITQPIPLLKRQHNRCLTLSQQQIACLLANAFLCTFPRRNSTNPMSEFCFYPSINFNRLLTGTSTKERNDSCIEKLKTILHYFRRVCDEMPSGVVTYERRVCKDFPIWNKSSSELCELHVRMEGLIEDDGRGMLQMDFANKYVGGGVLGMGMVQEEILFCIFPELIAARLYTEVMDDNECLFIIGAERFSKYSGYSGDYKWEGDYVDLNTRDSWRRKVSHFVALDSTPFQRSVEQYKAGNIRRELNKLYCGFQDCLHPDCSPAIATGNWGCGAFGGDPVLKALLQMMAAASVCRDLCYFTFRDGNLMQTIHDMHKFIKSSKLRVGDLWKLICQYNEREVMIAVKQKRSVTENIFEFIQRMRRTYDTSTDEE